MRLSIDSTQCRFGTDVRVRWADTDAGGIAYNGVYLTWLEVARVEYFRALAAFHRNVPIDDPMVQDRLLELYPLDFALASCSIEWRSPLRVDNRLRLWMRTSRIGNKSLDQQYVLTRVSDGQLVALAESTTVHIDKTMAATELPRAMVEDIEGFEEALRAGRISLSLTRAGGMDDQPAK